MAHVTPTFTMALCASTEFFDDTGHNKAALYIDVHGFFVPLYPSRRSLSPTTLVLAFQHLPSTYRFHDIYCRTVDKPPQDGQSRTKRSQRTTKPSKCCSFSLPSPLPSPLRWPLRHHIHSSLDRARPARPRALWYATRMAASSPFAAGARLCSKTWRPGRCASAPTATTSSARLQLRMRHSRALQRRHRHRHRHHRRRRLQPSQSQRLRLLLHQLLPQHHHQVAPPTTRCTSATAPRLKAGPR